MSATQKSRERPVIGDLLTGFRHTPPADALDGAPASLRVLKTRLATDYTEYTEYGKPRPVRSRHPVYTA